MLSLYTPEEIATHGDIRSACEARHKVTSAGGAYADAFASACIANELAYLRSNWTPIVPEAALARMPLELQQTARNTNDASCQLVRGCAEGIARSLPYLHAPESADSAYQTLHEYIAAFGDEATLEKFVTDFAALGYGDTFATCANSIQVSTFETEQSMAHMLSQLIQSSHRFHVDSEQWYVYRDNKWTPTAQMVVVSLVGAVLAGFSRIFAEEVRNISGIKGFKIQADTLQKLVVSVASASKVANVTSLLRVSPLLQQRGEFRQIPGILNAPNLTFDLRQSTVIQSSRNLYLTQSTGPVMDLSQLQDLYEVMQSSHMTPEEWFAARAPNWTRFLSEIFCEDAALIRYVRRTLGVALSGFNVDECFYLLHGKGANGKSTFISILRHIFADYSVSIPFQSVIKPPQYQSDPRRPDLLRMRDKRLTVITEFPAGYELDMAMMKTLTGRDPVDVRDNYAKSQAIKSFEPIALIMIACNNLPEVTEADRGTWRRIRKIPFAASFEGRADPFLRHKLISEAPYILLDILCGYYDYQSEPTLPLPECVVASVAQMQQDKDALVDWLAECIDVTNDKSDTVAFSLLVASYNAWCHGQMLKSMGINKFANGLSDRGITSITGPRGVRLRAGVKLLSSGNNREDRY